MFAITGITGNVGGNVARNLLAAGRPVRAVMRDVRKGDGWAERGCELATADILDVSALGVRVRGNGRRLRAGSAELRSGTQLSRGAGHGRHSEIGDRKSASGQSRIPAECSPQFQIVEKRDLNFSAENLEWNFSTDKHRAKT